MTIGLYANVGDADADLAALGQIDKWNQEGVSDPLAGPNPNAFKPGHLKMGAAVELHSRAAINLFRGRRADPAKGIRPINGLLRFANQVSKVWMGASRNDPIADLVLIRIEESFNKAAARVDTALERAKSMIDFMTHQGFTIEHSISVNPVKVELHFSTPWAWQGAMLLKKFDQLILCSLTAKHLGLIVDSNDWNMLVNSTANAMRNLFIQPDAYVLTNLQRHDFKRTVVYMKRHYDKAKRGVPFIPPEVLSGERRAKLAPSIKQYELMNEKEWVDAHRANTSDGADTKAADDSTEKVMGDVINSGAVEGTVKMGNEGNVGEAVDGLGEAAPNPAAQKPIKVINKKTRIVFNLEGVSDPVNLAPNNPQLPEQSNSSSSPQQANP